jgi:glycosyltransferase involved in cell wall biosynthesis
MRILALSPSLYDTSPGQRFRLEQWAPYLNQRGVEIDFQSFESEELHSLLYQPGRAARKVRLVLSAFARRLRLVRAVREYDAVYVFREAALLGPPLIERLIHRRGIPVVYDFDDAVFVPYKSPSNGYLSLLKFPGKTRAICRLAAHVMAGNDYLAEYAGQVNNRVTIVPTTIDTGKYTLRPKRTESRNLVIGWSGSYSTVQHLDTLRSALQRLAHSELFRLRVIGTPTYELGGVEIEATKWRSETEVDDLSGIDIGVMPLPEDLWSRGKCGLKALQYMALGIPTICSPVGVNSQIIKDGDNGFLASTDSEWIDRLTMLLRSRELRTRIGLAGRKTVEERYSAESQVSRVYSVFRSVVQGYDSCQVAETLNASAGD